MSGAQVIGWGHTWDKYLVSSAYKEYLKLLDWMSSSGVYNGEEEDLTQETDKSVR